MKRQSILVLEMVLVCFAMNSVRADMVLFEGFEDSSGFTIGGGYAHSWIYWGIAPLGGTTSFPSNFVQGGSQSGNIFYGSFAKASAAGGPEEPSPTMTISLPDLTWYTDVLLTVSLAAPDGTRWESSHRDSLLINGTTGLIDSFLPAIRGAPLTSKVYSTDLHYYFQDFQYPIDSSLTSLTFEFASTAYDEVVGIDSVSITGTYVPLPSAVILGSIGITFTGWLLKRRKML